MNYKKSIFALIALLASNVMPFTNGTKPPPSASYVHVWITL